MTPPDFNQEILNDTQAFIREFFDKNIEAEYVYHDLTHTINVVEETREIGILSGVSLKNLQLLEIAAWFHDTGYDQGADNHEERSAAHASKFLRQHAFSETDIKTIRRLILATKLPHEPKDLLEMVIVDADMSHLGKKIYWDRCGRVRQELLMTKDMLMSEQEWVAFELDFMENHQYTTPAARERFAERKEKHIKQLKKQRDRLHPEGVTDMDNLVKSDKKKKKKKKKRKQKKSMIVSSEDVELKELNLGRGVETMFRTTYRTHVNLSSIADNKANIMLSINAIIISIVLPQLVPEFDENPRLIIPTVILLGVCLASMVYATLSTRPKITEGKFSREDIEKKRSNLLFFGNYYSMSMEDYHWGMMEMIKDSDFLYSSMTRDLYWLGIVLSKKYRYLSICYKIFMFGMIGAVSSFAITFIMF